MNTLQKRLAGLDKRFRQVRPREPEFFCWKGDPWTPEQQAEATRRFPKGLRFSRPLVPGKDTDPVTRCNVWPPSEPREEQPPSGESGAFRGDGNRPPTSD